MIPLALALQVGGYVVSAALIVGGIKWAMNGMREDITEIKALVKAGSEADADQNDRLTALETQQENHKGWIGRLQDLFDRGLEAK